MTSDTPNPENQAADLIAGIIARALIEALNHSKGVVSFEITGEGLESLVKGVVGTLDAACYVIVPKTAVDAALRRGDAPI